MTFIKSAEEGNELILANCLSLLKQDCTTCASKDISESNITPSSANPN